MTRLFHWIRTWQVLLLICTTVTLMFAYTVFERHQWFGQMNSGLWLTGSTLKFSRNWYRDGAVNDAFLMLEYPAGIEFKNLQDRGIYVSYPPGCILPIYAISLLTQTEPNLAMVMSYNLFIQLLISLSFALIVYLAATRFNLGPVQTYLLAVMSAFFYLWAPYSMAYHQNRYFSDMAVLAPFALVILIDVLLQTRELSKKTRVILTLFQHFFLALGLFTDYLFVFLYAFLFIKKLLLGELGKKLMRIVLNTFLFSFSAIIPIGIFLYQVLHFDKLDALEEKFLFRTASNEAGQKHVTDFFEQFWKKLIEANMGTEAIVLVFGSVFFLLIAALVVIGMRVIQKRKADRTAVSLVGIALVVMCTCLFQLYFLKNHSVIHDFSAIKVCFYIAIVPFGLLPLAIGGLFPKIWNVLFGEGLELRCVFVNQRLLAFPLFILLLAAFFFSYIEEIHPNYKPLIDRVQKREEEFGFFLDKNTGFDDVVFSETVQVKANPPRITGLSMKLVYQVRSLQQIAHKIQDLPQSAVVNLLVDKTVPPARNRLVKMDIWKSADKTEDGNLILYKIPRADFLRGMNHIHH